MFFTNLQIACEDERNVFIDCQQRRSSEEHITSQANLASVLKCVFNVCLNEFDVASVPVSDILGLNLDVSVCCVFQVC